MKTFLIVLSVVLCSGAAGTGIALNFAARPVKPHPLNSSLFLAMAAEPSQEQRGNSAADVELATHTQQLLTITEELQADRDDRKLLHDQIYELTKSEAANYNQINDRLNVSDAKTTTVGWLIGILFTVTQSILLFFHIGDKNKRGRRASDGVGNGGNGGEASRNC